MNEQKILKSIVATYERKRDPFYLRTPFIVMGWILLVIALVAINAMLEAGKLNAFLAMALLLWMGAAIGFIFLIKASYKCHPFIKPYLDLEAIKRRLKELELKK